MVVAAVRGGTARVTFVLMGTFAMVFLLGFGMDSPSIAFGIMAFFMLLLGALYTVG